MRLINIKTLQLEEFFEKDIPPYAILSHRWGSEELNFKDVLKNRANKDSNGYKKLVGAAQAAAWYRGVHYLWIDTCCIDKKSSAELSEAINSMYSWYKGAQVCLAFLEDVKSASILDDSFRRSVWFTRCWTLQELLAPQVLDFFTGEWKYIGNRVSLGSDIEDVTGIPIRIIVTTRYLNYPVAQKMSWAANRFATRTEDIAYSLMGLFDVNMPLLYGEGKKAFVRLQEEILRRDTDLTVLLWGLNSTRRHLFASNPTDFQDFKDVQMDHLVPERKRFSLSNMGLELKTDLVKLDMRTYGLTLCYDGPDSIYAMLLRKAEETSTMYRVGLITLPTGCLWSKERQITLALQGPLSSSMIKRAHYGFEVQPPLALPVHPVVLEKHALGEGVEISRSEKYHPTGFECEFADEALPHALKLTWPIENDVVVQIDLSFDFESRPCALFYTTDHNRSVWEISEEISEKNFRLTMSPVNRECNMVQTQAGFFLRCSEDMPVIAPVPITLLAGARQVWAGLYPSWRDSEKQFWTFELLSNIEDLHNFRSKYRWSTYGLR